MGRGGSGVPLIRVLRGPKLDTLTLWSVVRYEHRSEVGMSSTVTISPKFQVVIPKAIRDELSLVPGQKVEALAVEGRIELVPVRDVKELRGIAKGIDTTVDREEDRV